MSDSELRSSEEIKQKITLSLSQIDKMAHTIGYEPSAKKKYIPYRNFYDCGECDLRDFDYLVFWGLASKPRKGLYKLTQLGCDVLSEIYHTTIILE